MVSISVKPIEQLYQETIERAAIPVPTDTQELQHTYLVRNLVVSLDEVLEHIAEQSERFTQAQIYADIVRISSNTTPLQFGAKTILVVARKIEVAGTRTIELSEASQGFVLYAQELEGTLHFTHVDRPTTIAWTLEQMPTDSVGLEIYAEQNQIRHDLIQRVKNDMVRWLRPTRLLLSTQLQLAAALFTTHFTETYDLLQWIIFFTKGVSEARDLYRQSEALLTRLLLSSSEAIFVPSLSLETYQKEANALTETVKAYEQQYQRFQDKNIDLSDRQAIVRLMQQYNNATIEAHQSLINQAREILSQSREQSEEAKQKCLDQQYLVKLAKIEFERGLEDWKNQQKWNAMRRMFLAIADFAISVGTAAASGGAGTGEAIASGLSALQAMKELVGESDAIYQQMQRVLVSMEQMEALVQKLDTLMKSLFALTDGNPDTEVELPNVFNPQQDLISGQAEWDVFLATTNVYLQQALNENIGGAPAYKLESEKLAIYGKAFLASQAAVVKAAQEVWQLQIQSQISQSQQQPLQDYLQELEEREELYNAILQLLFQQQLNQKCWLFLALQNLIWAYQYETLTERKDVPPITSTVLHLETTLNSIVHDLNTILEQLNPPPQNAEPRQLITAVETEYTAYAGVVEALKRDKAVVLTIPLDDFAFRGLERVRLKRWRCVLQGVPIPEGRRISLTLESSGIHTDRRLGNTYQFAAYPSKRKFVYENAHPDMHNTITDEELNVTHAIYSDGEVAEEYKTHYMRPTPFTQWKLQLDDNEGIIDLSSLQSLKILWLVEAIITNPTR